MAEIRQIFPKRQMNASQIRRKIALEVQSNHTVAQLPKGSSVAVTAGSRGISNITLILRTVVDVLKQMGHHPFLIPAMGSHGGATADGQVEALRHLGITEETMGAEIRSSMDVEQIARTDRGVPVYMDKHACRADGIIVVNRVKAHTAFRGRVESGLSKMITIGLGKREGASFVHINGVMDMADNIEEVCRTALRHAPIVMGLAIIEDSYDHTSEIFGVSKEKWFEKEAEILKRSKKMMPKLPIEEIDILIIEEMGKNFSGTGMDPNIIGRWRIEGVPEPKYPRIKRIAVLDLSPQSQGNAQGIGLADFTTQRLVDDMDRNSTYTNALTSTFLQRVMLPIIGDTDQDVWEMCLQSLGPGADPKTVKWIQIPNTLHLDRMYVSEQVLVEMKKQEGSLHFELLGTHPVAFNTEKKLTHKLKR